MNKDRPNNPPEPPAFGAETPTLVLVRGAHEGHQAALDELFRRYLPRLERFARGRLPGYARGTIDTLDLVQDALLNSLAQLDHFDPRSPGCFQAYTRQAILNAIRNRVQRVKPKAAQTRVLANAQDMNPSPWKCFSVRMPSIVTNPPWPPWTWTTVNWSYPGSSFIAVSRK